MVNAEFEPVKVPLYNRPMGIIGSVMTARKNALHIIPDIALQQPILSGVTGKRWHMLMDPKALRHVLVDKVDEYPKSLVTKNVLRPAVGASMFVAEGAHWKWQRRAAAPVFSLRNIATLTPVMARAAERTLDRLGKTGAHAVNVHDEMVTATFEVISDVTFTGENALDRDMVHRAIDAYLESGAKITAWDMMDAPEWVPRIGRMLASRQLVEMKKQADAAIEDRKKRQKAGDQIDLLDLLIAGKDSETNRHMNTNELRDNLLAFIIAGHETTALALSWALYLLANHPDIQDRAIAEASGVLNGRIAQAQDVANLPFIRQVIDETMRLYPPAGIISRTALEDDAVCGRKINRGDTIIIPIYALHRSRLLWKNPDKFDPDRFADAKAIDRFAYIPFADGPRICIGAQFALQEAVVILASILARYRFSPVQGKSPKPVMVLTLRPEGGVWLTKEPV